MSPWLERDESQHSGEPVVLMQVTRADGVLRYANNDEGFTYALQWWEPSSFTIGPFNQGHEPEATAFQITLPLDHPLVLLLGTVGDVLIGETEIVIITGHRGETDAAVAFGGAVTEMQLTSRGDAVFTVETWDGLAQQQVPRMTVAIRCQNVVGDHLCRVDLETMKFESTISAIDLQDGRQITVAGLAAEEDGDAAWFIGGTVWRLLTAPDTWVVAGFIQYRGSGNIIVLMDPNPYLQTGDPIKIYPGDDRHITTCVAKFNNVVNFTGTMPMGNPDRSIMEGTGFLGYALEEDLTGNGTTPDEAPRPV